jgi:hypothetical protein
MTSGGAGSHLFDVKTCSNRSKSSAVRPLDAIPARYMLARTRFTEDDPKLPKNAHAAPLRVSASG